MLTDLFVFLCYPWELVAANPAGHASPAACNRFRFREQGAKPTFKPLGIVKPATKRSLKMYFLQQHVGQPKFAHYIPPSRDLSRLELFIKGIDAALRAIGPVAPRSASQWCQAMERGSEALAAEGAVPRLSTN